MSEAGKLNLLLENNNLGANDLIPEVNNIFRRMDIRDQLDIHGSLTLRAINKLYPVLNPDRRIGIIKR